MTYSAQLPMGNASEVTREPSSHVTSETQAGHWVQQKDTMPRLTGKPRRHSCPVKIRAVSTRSASGGQWHPTGSVKCQTGTWEAPSRSHLEKAYANPHA